MCRFIIHCSAEKLKFYLWNEILVSTIKSHKKRPSSLPAMLKWCWVPCSTQTQNRWMVKTFVCSALLVKREIFSSAQKNSPRWRWIRGIAISLNDANEVVLSIFSALSYPQRQSAIWKCWCSQTSQSWILLGLSAWLLRSRAESASLKAQACVHLLRA